MNCFRNSWPVKPALLVFVLVLACIPAAGQVAYSAVKSQASVPDTSKSPSDSLQATLGQYKVVKKDLVPEDQVRIGTTIMVVIIVVMSFMNNFNPE